MVVYPLRDVLDRIEADVRELKQDVHAVQLTLATSRGTAAADAATHAAGRARVATWVAAGAAVAGPLSAVLIAVVGR